jgi:polyribonucleotide nucleotidyltransferase
MKIIDQTTGQEIPRAEGEEPEQEFSASRPPRREGGGGGRDRRPPRREAS